MPGDPVRVHPRDRNEPTVERYFVQVTLEVVVCRRLADLDRAGLLTSGAITNAVKLATPSTETVMPASRSYQTTT